MVHDALRIFRRPKPGVKEVGATACGTIELAPDLLKTRQGKVMESNNQESLSNAPPPDQLRRKLFRGVSGGVGVMLAVPAKTALGTGLCQSPSAMMSGNTSPRPGNGSSCSGGLSPGYWKQPQHAGSWPVAGATFPTFKKNVDLCTTTGMKALTLDNVKTAGTTFANIGFNGVSIKTTTTSTTWQPSIWAVLAFPGNYNGGQLLRHLVAAWLNAGKFTSQSQKYPLTQAQVVAMWDATKSGGTYCPSGSSCTKPWTAADVIAYIDGMYDLNASGGDPPLCENN